MPQPTDFMEALQEVCALDPASLSEDQAGFIRARREYLTDEQKKTFADVLGKVPAAGSAEPKMDEIRERANALDIKIPVGMKKADALALVTEAEAKAAEAAKAKEDEEAAKNALGTEPGTPPATE